MCPAPIKSLKTRASSRWLHMRIRPLWVRRLHTGESFRGHRGTVTVSLKRVPEGARETRAPARGRLEAITDRSGGNPEKAGKL